MEPSAVIAKLLKGPTLQQLGAYLSELQHRGHALPQHLQLYFKCMSLLGSNDGDGDSNHEYANSGGLSGDPEAQISSAPEAQKEAIRAALAECRLNGKYEMLT